MCEVTDYGASWIIVLIHEMVVDVWNILVATSRRLLVDIDDGRIRSIGQAIFVGSGG
jgi:hypothetical protein